MMRKPSTTMSPQARKPRNIKARAVMPLVALSLAGAGLAAAAPASATATNCTSYGVGIKGPVRNGSFCSTLHGSGTWFEYVNSNYGTTLPGVDRVCNPQVKVDVYSRFGGYIRTFYGDQQTGCSWGSYNFPANVPIYMQIPAAANGYAMTTLLSYGSPVAAVRTNIGS